MSLSGKSGLVFTVMLLLWITEIQGNEEPNVTVIYPAAQIEIEEGKTLVLNCKVEYNTKERPDVTWYKNLEKTWAKIEDGNHTSIFKTPESYKRGDTIVNVRFTIPKSKLSDSGSYQCSAITGSTDSTAMGHIIKVTVNRKQQGEQVLNPTNNGMKNTKVAVEMLCILSFFLYSLPRC